MSQTELIYQKFLAMSSDIQKHLPILRLYAEKCPRIIELGFRGGVSTAALMAARPSRLTIIDWDKPPFQIDRQRLTQIIHDGLDQKTTVEFQPQDSMDAWLNEADMLFLDTFHTYEHLFLELIRHADSIMKYMLIHDTDESSCPGMFNAVEDFLMDNRQWQLGKRLRERPGLTILERTGGWGTFQYSKAFTTTLYTEVRRQKEMYYDSIGHFGTTNPEWREYIEQMKLRFADAQRWPLTNSRESATEIMALLAETESPQTDR